MIVKNESKIIERCLDSLKGTIDYWIIVDTGSTDGTQNIIKKCMKGIPGKLYERPWVNFGHNRTEAIELAKGKGDYVLFIDADEKLEFLLPFDKAQLTKDVYFVTVREVGSGGEVTSGLDYQRPLLVNNHLPWSWKGLQHEELVPPEQELKTEFLTSVINLSNSTEGARSQDPQKHIKIAKDLEQMLLKDPTNARTMFYIAQSYANGGDFESAIQSYEKRATMGGWDQEIFWSLYKSATLQEHVGKPKAAIIHAYCRAFQFRPSRAEPLYRLVQYFLKEQEPILAYLLAKEALSIPMPDDLVFVEKMVYEFDLLVQFSNAASMLGKFADTCWAYEQLLSRPLPEGIRRQVKNNFFVVKSKTLTAPTNPIR
jgi:glycosyltransferase involved in cell wall biosynthesis